MRTRARTRLRVRLELRAGGGLEALAALVKDVPPPRPGALRLAAALAGDAAGARALARRGARHAATKALDDGRTSDAAASLLAAVVSASESDDDDDDEGLVAYGSAVFRRTLRGRQRSHCDVLRSARGRQCINAIAAAHPESTRRQRWRGEWLIHR